MCIRDRYQRRVRGKSRFQIMSKPMLGLCLWPMLVAVAAPIPAPQGLQGHDDENWPVTLMGPNQTVTPTLSERYAVLATMHPGIRRYNMYWSAFEPTPSSNDSSRVCAPGYELHPLSPGGMHDFHRFHCYSTAQLRQFDLIFSLDRSIGAQGAAILYSAPDWATEPNCTGFVFGKDRIRAGCVPTSGAMPDYEDMVTLFASRYSPHLKHYIVWNEVASAGWMDCSPQVPNRAGPNGESPLTELEFEFWVNKYAEMVPVSYTHLRAHETPEHLVCRLLLEKKKKNKHIHLITLIKLYSSR
eukprot:TRINITY_DN4678_c0_g1_i1.p1 TRINITY_DN4678_c0_g1~~TRINITY_DN4678_c0_g1_i1.p1  ORF type:complete len:299 (-),score=54.10 TRINITY_DN4678_c0_g1_i1:63-959(-)